MERRLESVALALLLAALMGCTQSPPTSPSPGGGSGSEPGPGPASAAPGVSGTVFETTAGGRRPLGGAYLLVMVRLGGTINGTTMNADAEGRYSIPQRLVVNGGTAIVYAAGGAGRHQPCVASAAISGETVLDVEYNPKEVPGTMGSPTVSGVVFRSTPEGRQPLVDHRVMYYAANLLAAQTVTDGAGHYRFCSVPQGAGSVFVPDPFDFDLGGPLIERDVQVLGDVVLDLEIVK